MSSVPNDFSSDSDEETWKMLASSNVVDGLGDRLTDLALRFEEDCDSTTFWENLTNEMKRKGFPFSSAAPGRISNSTPKGSKNKPVVALESAAGKHHIEAVMALLQISYDRAIQITMESLGSIDSGGTFFQTMLGGRQLLWKTLLHEQKQRLARLGVVTELLRVEQDPDALIGSHVKTFLNSLDGLYCDDEDRHRGLFRHLLTIACRPILTTTREQLSPTRSLRATMVGGTDSRPTTQSLSSGQEWNSFCVSIVEELRMQQMRERKEALEALLILLYDRMKDGVRRADYVALLLAFRSQGFFLNASSSSGGPKDLALRLTQLTGLICAECMALWRTLDSSSTWISLHPLLLGLSSDSTTAKEEIDTIRNLLSDYVQESLNGGRNGIHPESLGMLGFGLLLQLACKGLNVSNSMMEGDDNIFFTLNTNAMEMVQIANDQCGAFDYLHSILDHIAPTTTTDEEEHSVPHECIYDWQFSDRKDGLLLNDTTESQNTASDATAYTSIVREVLAASITAYGGTVLAVDQSNSLENIGMLCSLGSKIFQNSPSLCQQFWSDWEIYSTDASTVFPMCALLDASYQMTTTAFQIDDQGRISPQIFVQAVAPFFHLLSSLSHNSGTVDSIIASFPSGLLRRALLCCRLPPSSVNPLSQEFRTSRIHLLSALGRLSRFGNSSSALVDFRASLEETDNFVDGPRVLSRLIAGDQNDTEIVDHVLTVMAHLLDGAPTEWAAMLAGEIMNAPRDSQSISLARCFAHHTSTIHGASLVLAQLIEHMTAIVFSDTVNNNDTVSFLHGLESTIHAGAGALASSLYAMTNDSSPPFGTAQCLLQSISKCLKVIRTVIQLHDSPEVRTSGVKVRDAIIERLGTSTGIGQAIMYYATAPVSLTLAIKLQEAVDDESIMLQDSAENDYDPGAVSKYGAWHSYLSHRQRGKSSQEVISRYLVDIAAKLTSDDIDLDGISARGWAGSQQGKAIIDASFSSMTLLSQWASHVDDIVSTHYDDLRSEPRPFKGKAMEIVQGFSPFGLLSSMATVPVPCQNVGTMVSFWDSACLSNMELLLPYLTRAIPDNVHYAGSKPSCVLLDLLNTCLNHLCCTTSRDVMADTAFVRGLSRSPRFSTAVASSIERATSLSSSRQSYSLEEKATLLEGMLSLRVLASCVSSSPTMAYDALYPNDTSIVSKLVSLASSVKSLPLLNGGMLFSEEIDVTRVRLATGAIAALSGLWQSVRAKAKTSKLSKAMDEVGSFILDLTGIVSSFARSTDLEERLALSASADYAHGTLVTYMAVALKILATEVVHQSPTDSASTRALEDFLLRDVFPSSRFVDFTGYHRLSDICSETKNLGYVDTLHPHTVLACFPSTSSAGLVEDYFSNCNSFDVSAAWHFIEEHAAFDESLYDVVLKFSMSHQLTNANLMIMEAWKDLSETAILFSPRLGDGGLSSGRQFGLIDDTVSALEANLFARRRAKEEGTDILASASKQMASLMGELLLFFLDIGTTYCASMRSEPLDVRLSMLEKLASVANLAISAESSELDCTSLTLARTILACAIVALEIIDLDEFGSTEKGRIYEVFKIFCRTSCIVIPLARESILLDSQDKDSHKSLLCCVSLLTLIFSRKVESSVYDAIYLKELLDILGEHNAIGEVVTQAASSALAASSQVSKDEVHSRHAQIHLVDLQAILDLLAAVADTGRSDLLNILAVPNIAQLLVRNPLFATQFATKNPSIPRGYELRHSNQSASTATFKVGEDDPLHAIWRTSLRVLTAATSSSQSDLGIRSYEVIYEFLEVYRNELVFALECCGSSLTLNGVKEATDILGMIAQMCRRHTRDEFQQRLGSLCSIYISKASFVLAVLSKFLGASGTARELFDGIERHANDGGNFEIGKGPAIRYWHPLIAEGIPSAKHAAVKFAHYASKCRQAVSARDFQESSRTSDCFKSSPKGSLGENDLERSSRMTITSSFAVKMEQQVAACIGEALAVLWRMHPVSFSFRSLSEAEISGVDVMALAPIGSIIGFRPFEGHGSVFLESHLDHASIALSFGRVESIDTMMRTWRVSNINSTTIDDEGNDDSQQSLWTVRAGQLACYEDTSFRKAITTYLPAPDSLSDLDGTGNKLSLGHLILILRWCHQESLFWGNSGTSSGAATRRLAEQASALLGAELSVHHENGESLRAASKERSRLDAQIFELMADSDELEQGPETSSVSQQHGRLKALIGSSAWQALRPQVIDQVHRCQKERQDKERREKEKRSFSGRSSYQYSGVYLSAIGFSGKSAFRGFQGAYT